jgi:hypothetical protein
MHTGSITCAADVRDMSLIVTPYLHLTKERASSRDIGNWSFTLEFPDCAMGSPSFGCGFDLAVGLLLVVPC